jgi:hypothetical protein
MDKVISAALELRPLTNGKALFYRDERIIGNRDRMFPAAGIPMEQKKENS